MVKAEGGGEDETKGAATRAAGEGETKEEGSEDIAGGAEPLIWLGDKVEISNMGGNKTELNGLIGDVAKIHEGAKYIIEFADRDPLNFRRENIVLLDPFESVGVAHLPHGAKEVVNDTGWRKELVEMLSKSKATQKESANMIHETVVEWAQKYFPATPATLAGELPDHILLYLEHMVFETDQLVREFESVKNSKRLGTSGWMFIDYWVDLAFILSSSNEPFAGTGFVSIRNVGLFVFVAAAVAQIIMSIKLGESYAVAAASVLGMKPFAQAMILKRRVASATNEGGFGGTLMVDLGLKTFPMAIIATYSVASSVNPPPIQLLCIWIGLWVASQRFEEVEGTLNNHKQSQRVFPEYVGYIPKTPYDHALTRVGLQMVAFGALSSKLLALACMMLTFNYETNPLLSYEVLAGWLALECGGMTMVDVFVFKSGTQRPTHDAHVLPSFHLLWNYLSLLCLPWPTLRAPWFVGPGMWASFAIYSNCFANPAMLLFALRFNENEDILMSKNSTALVTIMIVTTLITIVGATVCWRHMDPAYHDTFNPMKHVTLKEYLDKTFDTRVHGRSGRGTGLDAGRAMLVDKFHHYYWPTEKVRR
eukprot:CAMPEP_0119493442 /NCGR_PEP_ID=MMETSP1344-20130328/17692_1 /TAXON_ID=236787 /ORGANISM="Florenciella parvula, Strain CCMP2471" /LENGTH=591 /DNA_ID=CAMNT_0007528869 /DNA_START=27 /DNA_END=1798 /DNA_ORIENTATION=+